MAKVTTKTKKALAKQPSAKQRKEMFFPFGKENFIIIGIGIVDLIIGYIFLAQGPLDGFAPMVIAPILLILGYCVIIPYGILKKPRKEIEASGDFAVSSTAAAAAQTPQASSISSNIKTG